MDPSRINFYTSDLKVQELKSYTDVLAENMNLRVELLPLSQQPNPDTQRPTRQQLRSEQEHLRPTLLALRDNIGRVELAGPELADYLPAMRELRERFEARLEFIRLALSEEKGDSAL